MAADAGAVPETLGDAGVLIREKRLDEIGLMAHAIVTDDALAQKIVDGQYRVLDRMEALDHTAMLMRFVNQAMATETVSR
jgi:hypothetical protein